MEKRGIDTKALMGRMSVLGRLGVPEDMAQMALFLASDESTAAGPRMEESGPACELTCHRVGKMSAPNRALAAKEWREYWPVVAACVAGVALGSLHSYSIGVMISPLEQEFRWTRAQISSGMLISSVFSVLFSPLMGMLIDCFGPRRIGVMGAAVYCCALAMLSLATPSIWSWWLLWSILAVALLQIKPTVWVTAITSFFNESRGLAIAVALSAVGLSALVTPIITYHLVEWLGWRMAYVALSAGWGTLTLPIIFIWFSSAQDKERTQVSARQSMDETMLIGLTWREGLRTASFYRLAAATFTMSLGSAAVMLNLIPIFTFTGLPRASAATVAGLGGFFAVIGRLMGGYLLDRFNARLVSSLSVLLPAIPCALLLGIPGSLSSATASAVLLGLASGAGLDAVAYLAGRHFGMRNFGVLFGAITGVMTLGIGLGPVLANHVYDVTKSYAPVLWSFIPLSLLASWLFLSTGSYPKFAEV